MGAVDNPMPLDTLVCVELFSLVITIVCGSWLKDALSDFNDSGALSHAVSGSQQNLGRRELIAINLTTHSPIAVGAAALILTQIVLVQLMELSLASQEKQSWVVVENGCS